MILKVERMIVEDADFDPAARYYRNEAVFKGVRVHDRMRVAVTGTSGGGIRYERLAGTIDTVCEDGFKLWPDGDAEGGKVWFLYEHIESLEKICPA